MCRLSFLLALLAVAVMQTNASATIIENVTAGTTVFADDYEGVTANTLPAPDTTADYLPVATTGTWNVDYSGTRLTQVANLASPGAAQGSNYLRIYRQHPDYDDGIRADGSLSTPQATTGDVLKFSTMVYLPSATDVADRATIALSGTGFTTDARAFITTDGAGSVFCYDAGWANKIDTGVNYQTDVWQQWDVTYAVGAGTFSLAIDGNSASGLTTMSAGSVGVVSMINNAYQQTVGGSVYFDAVPVPEPSAIALMVSAMVGLLAYAWRKRK